MLCFQKVTMKTRRILPLLALAIVAALVAAPANAGGRHHGGSHSHFVFGLGVGVGYPWYGYGYGYYPYYPYYPAYAYYPPYAVQQQPQVYVEQPQAQQPAGYWYYCSGSRAYYPYVKDCPAGWQRVAPQPQN